MNIGIDAYLDQYVSKLNAIIDKKIGFYEHKVLVEKKKLMEDKYFLRKVMRESKSSFICKRNVMVDESLIDREISVYNGKRLETFLIKDFYINYRVGEFCFTKFFLDRVRVHKRNNFVKNTSRKITKFDEKKKAELQKRNLMEIKQKELKKELEELKREEIKKELEGCYEKKR